MPQNPGKTMDVRERVIQRSRCDADHAGFAPVGKNAASDDAFVQVLVSDIDRELTAPLSMVTRRDDRNAIVRDLVDHAARG